MNVNIGTTLLILPYPCNLDEQIEGKQRAMEGPRRASEGAGRASEGAGRASEGAGKD